MISDKTLYRAVWIVNVVFLALAGGITLVAGGRLASGFLTPFHVWMTVPYAAFLATSASAYAVPSVREPAAWTAAVVSFFMLGITAVWYLGGDFSSSSTACIGLVFAPLWLLLGSHIFFVVGLSLGWLARKCSRLPDQDPSEAKRAEKESD